MRVLVTGATSFVGAWFCRVAGERHQVLALGHSMAPAGPDFDGVEGLQGNLASPQLLPVLREWQPDVVAHLAFKVMGSGDPGPRGRAVAQLNRAMMSTVIGLQLPILYASSTCVSWPMDTAYARSRRQDEQRLAESGLPWASLRPCAPFGPHLKAHRPGHTESFHTLAASVKRGLVPVIGAGEALRQPIHVQDFAAAGVKLLEQGLPGRAFDAGGAELLSFNAIVDRLAALVGKTPIRLNIPRRLLVAAARFVPDMEPELLDAAETDDPADPGPLEAATGLRMRGFSEAASELLG